MVEVRTLSANNPKGMPKLVKHVAPEFSTEHTVLGLGTLWNVKILCVAGDSELDVNVFVGRERILFLLVFVAKSSLKSRRPQIIHGIMDCKSFIFLLSFLPGA